MVKAERTPSVTRNEEVGFTEIVTDDVPTVTAPIIAANVEVLYDLHDRSRIIGCRVYDQSLSTQQPMGEVRVKALEWRFIAGNPKDRYDQWRCDSIVGEYFIDKTSRGYEGFLRGHSDIQCGKTLEEAKAASEADYRDRILSALHPNQEGGE